MQEKLFEDITDKNIITINNHCWIRINGDFHVVEVSNARMTLAQYDINDFVAKAYAMVILVEQGWAYQNEVAKGFNCSPRTVRRYQRAYERGGIAGLARYRRIKRRTPKQRSRNKKIVKLRKKGHSKRAIARQVGVDEKTVRNVLKRMGWIDPQPEQLVLPQMDGFLADDLLSSDDALSSRNQSNTKASSANSTVTSEASSADSAVTSDDALSHRNQNDVEASSADSAVTSEASTVAAGDALSPRNQINVEASSIEVSSGDALSPRNQSDAKASSADSVVTSEASTVAAGDALSPRNQINVEASSADSVVIAETSDDALSSRNQSDAKASSAATTDTPQEEVAMDVSEEEIFPVQISLDVDPKNRVLDRLFATLGLLDDAAPLFSNATQVPGAGVLLAVPSIVQSGVVEAAREVYGSIGPAFYGLRTVVVMMVLMALLRIKRPEALKENSPQELGQIIGLDRAPEVKTLRNKLTMLAKRGKAMAFGRALAKRRVEQHGHALGFLYVDGHVRVYHGKRTLPKTHVSQKRTALPASTDYWVNDAECEPLFVLPTEANRSLTQTLPSILEEVRQLLGERRTTVIFDRGGWIPTLFQRLINEGFDIITYRKGRCRKVARRLFQEHQAIIDGQKVCYTLADKGVYLLKRKLRLRQVTILRKDGGQTHIVTSRRDLPAIEVAYRMVKRWRQENFFKYLKEEFALDALVDYGVEEADADREVPNPARKKLNEQIRKAYAEVSRLCAQYGLEAFDNPEHRRPTMRGFKIAHSELSEEIMKVMERIVKLEKKRKNTPTRLPVGEVAKEDVIKLSVEQKHLTDLLKMVAYQVESDLVKKYISPLYSRSEDEGKTLIQEILSASADIEVRNDNLHIKLSSLSSPHRTNILISLCREMTEQKKKFPGTDKQMRFSVKKQPPKSMAFPGERTSDRARDGIRPDKSGGG